MFTPITETLL